MEFYKFLSELRFKSSHNILLFLITITVPGIVIIFYFFRELFDSYEIVKLLMLQVGISSAFFISAYSICSGIILSLEIKHLKEGFLNDENDYLEGVFSMSSQISLVILFILILIYYLCGSKCFQSFVLIFIGAEIIYGILAYFSVNFLLRIARSKLEEQYELDFETQEDKKKRKEALYTKLFNYRKLLAQTEIQINSANEFQFLRSNNTKKLHLMSLASKKLNIEKRIQEIEGELKLNYS